MHRWTLIDIPGVRANSSSGTRSNQLAMNWPLSGRRTNNNAQFYKVTDYLGNCAVRHRIETLMRSAEIDFLLLV